MTRAKRKDPEAIEQLFERTYPKVSASVHQDLASDLRQGRPWLARRFSTGDVVQEVFRSLLNDLDRFRGTTEHALMAYLSMISRNRLMDAIRMHEAALRDGRRTSGFEDGQDAAREGNDPSLIAIRNEELERFTECLEEFDEREQLLLRERLEHQARFQDLAPALGYSSVSAAKRAFYTCQAKILLRLSAGGAAEEPQ